MENYPLSVAESLLRAGAFKISLNPLYTWTSGVRSPVYCDLRALISDVAARREIVNAFAEMISQKVECDVIAGTATAGIPWAAWVAEKLGKPMIYVRSEAKEHGTKKRIEGILPAGSKVVLIEDHISTGKSSISALQALREEGQATVDYVFAINTYQLKAADEVYANAGVHVRTITDYSVILSAAKAQGLIDDEKEKMLSEFRNDPAAWAAAHGFSD